MAAARPLPRCCYCGQRVAHGDRFDLSLERRDAERVVLRWHLAPCAAEDPLHLALADALRLPDGPEGDDAARAAYLAVRDRVAAEQGAEGLRACIDVRRDLADPRWTLRGPGLSWGRLTPRVRPSGRGRR